LEQQLEHHEHAEHASGHGNKRAALLVAILAACLAIAEQGSKHAEIRVSENSIAAADAWTQYQGKSIRQALAHDLAELGGTLAMPPGDAAAAVRKAVLDRLAQEQVHYDQDPGDGKQAIARRAHGFEEARDAAESRTHSYDNAAAAFELGIVLATVSVIATSDLLLLAGMGLGVVGLVLTLLGWLAPAYGSF
jgi:uncharacterized protein DUF4337